MYEVNNTGNLYNLGFLIGVCILMSGGGCSYKKKKTRPNKEWDDIAEKLEEKILPRIEEWMNKNEKKNIDEWEEIGRMIETKIKQELKNWAAK